MGKVSKYILEIVVFIAGASLMIMEIVGSRVLAPYVGTSTIVWTSLIGIVLGSLSLGYLYGGRLADKNPSVKTLSFVLFLSAFFVFLIVLINTPLLTFIRYNIGSVYAGAVIGAIFLFTIPSFLLGIVSPYAVKLKMTDLNISGQTVGTLYALSTIGSIVGTFVAGFVLIPAFGTVRILYIISLLLIFCSLLLVSNNFFKTRVVAILFLLILMLASFAPGSVVGAKSLIDIDTKYSRIWVYPSRLKESGREVLNLVTDPFAVQSSMFLDGDDDLVHRYAKYYRLADFFNPGIKNVLMLGGAAYSYPRDFLAKHPEAQLTVVEIDEGMTELAQKYFRLEDNPRLKIVHADGRVFLNNNEEKFDAIFLDAFTSRLSIPYQLTTREAVQLLDDSLAEDGVVMLNLISALEGERSKFLQAEYKTYQEVFPYIYLFLADERDEDAVHNIILVASRQELKTSSNDPNLQEYLRTIWEKDISTDLPILTDDYAPVDYYVKNLVR